MSKQIYETSHDIPSPESLLRFHQLRPKKAWGQNFLKDGSVLDRVVGVLDPSPDDLVVELGAGLGHLTARLAQSGASLVAVERDRDLVPILEDLFHATPNVRILAADAKTVDYARIKESHSKLLVVGNLPYHLTTPILFSLLEHRHSISRAVLMVQKEVGDRLAASPGGKDYGVISVQAAMWTNIRIAFNVSAGSFHPPPRVSSCVLRMDFLDQPAFEHGDPEVFRQVVRGAFSKRRKTLRNTLKTSGVLSSHSVEDVLNKVGIDPSARAETISLEGFAALSRVISDNVSEDSNDD